MIFQFRPIDRAVRRSAFLLALVLAAAFPRRAAAVDDVLLQTVAGKIVTGIVDDESFTGRLGQRVHRQQFLSSFRSANPGFVALATGNPALPPGAEGFPSHHDVNFDLRPMTVGPVSSNLFYWDGSDIGDNGYDLNDVNFVKPESVIWEVLDAGNNAFVVDGSDLFVPGGLIERTSSDIDPLDGIDTGSIHKHLVLELNVSNGSSGTLPNEGVYMISWQARSAGITTSEPFFFVLRTSTISNAVRDIAAEWVEAHIDMLSSPPGDYNRDGAVDAADYAVWRATAGQSGVALAADGDLSGRIDPRDYALWKANFGRFEAATGRVAVTPVPEPPAACLALVALAASATRRFTSPF